MSRNSHKNKLKTMVAITLATVFAVIGAIIAIATVQKDEPIPETSNNSANSSVQQGTNDTDSSVCGNRNAPCTKEEVAKHNTKADCWVIYKSNYYIVTKYVSKHPGGSSVFNDKTCGTDIENFLNGTKASNGLSNKHGSNAYAELESYKVGPVN
jgi:cytochrome b involved in lipid metabolism